MKKINRKKLLDRLPLLITEKRAELYDESTGYPELKTDIEKTELLIKALADIKVPEEQEWFKSRLTANVRDSLKENPKPIVWKRVLKTGAAFATMLIVIFAAWSILKTNKMQNTEDWLVENISNIDDMHDEIAVPIPYLTNDEAETLINEIDIQLGDQIDEGILYTMPAIINDGSYTNESMNNGAGNNTVKNDGGI